MTEMLLYMSFSAGSAVTSAELGVIRAMKILIHASQMMLYSRG